MKRLLLPLLLTTVALIFLSSLFNTDMSRYRDSHEIKKVLMNGIKECIVRDAKNETPKFKDVRSYSEEYRRFKIQPFDPGSCFKAKAFPEDKSETWFEIDLNNDTGEVSKTCGDSSKPGCDEGNTW